MNDGEAVAAGGGTVITAFEFLAARFDALTQAGGRRIIGITGPPGAGKSTIAQRLHDRDAERCALAPMDGFHLANRELARLGRSKTKGAHDTFDSAGYVALLRRLRSQQAGEVIYAPEFRRELEEPIAGAIPIVPGQSLVITEGNYLLLDVGHWRGVRPLIDEVWYLDIPPRLRVERLVGRHVAFGRDERAAREWVERSDEVNAVLIESSRARADVIVALAD